MNSLKDKIAIITGAVGNLGTATARAFQQAGANTVLVDRSPDRVRSVLVTSPTPTTICSPEVWTFPIRFHSPN